MNSGLNINLKITLNRFLCFISRPTFDMYEQKLLQTENNKRNPFAKSCNYTGHLFQGSKISLTSISKIHCFSARHLIVTGNHALPQRPGNSTGPAGVASTAGSAWNNATSRGVVEGNVTRENCSIACYLLLV